MAQEAIARAAVAALLGATTLLASGAAGAVDLDPFGRVDLRYHGWFVFDDDFEGAARSEDLISRPESRVRLGLRLPSSPEGMEAEVSVVTGDPSVLATQWQPLGALDDPRTISLERAWFGARPDVLPELRVRLGRAPIPWARTGLLWEPQVTLPGLWVDYTHDDPQDPDALRVRVNGGLAYLIADGPNIRDESTLLGAQVAAELPMGSGLLEVALGYFDLSGATFVGQAIGREEAVVAQRPAGFTSNTTDSDAEDAEAELSQRLVEDGLASDFNLISLDGQVTLDLLEHMPLSLRAHVTWNVGASGPGGDQALGLLGGVGLGELERPGRGRVRVHYLRIAADAALDLLNREHYGTNVEGVEVTGDLVVAQGWTIGFVSLYSWQVEPALRGLGDGRGEPIPGDPSSLRTLVNTGYAF